MIFISPQINVGYSPPLGTCGGGMVVRRFPSVTLRLLLTCDLFEVFFCLFVYASNLLNVHRVLSENQLDWRTYYILYRLFCIPYWLLLFSDAEVCKDVAEDFVGGDFAACDFGEVEEGFADVLGYEVGWDIGL